MKKTINSTAELARHLGVSRWAVSRALNGHDGVSSATVTKVRDAMAEFNFTPSLHGRGLQGGRTGTIGICFRAFDTPVVVQKIAHFQKLVSERGYRPIFEVTELDQRMGLDVINHFISLRVEGVLLVDMPVGELSASWVKLLAQNHIPAAFLEPLGQPLANSVSLDRQAAMTEVTDRLLDLGHEFFALLGIGEQFPMGRPRYVGIEDALRRRGLSLQENAVIINLPHTRPAGLHYGDSLGAALLASAGKKPTALLAINDEVAVGVMWHLRKAGFSVPEDFSLFGFDNLPIGAQSSPSLCTVDHQIETTGQRAIDLLFQLISSATPRRIKPCKVAPQIILRESIGPAKPRLRALAAATRPQTSRPRKKSEV